MEKFVITYWEGSEFEGCNMTRCIEYSSAEVFLCIFEDAIKVRIEQMKEYDITYKKYLKNIKEFNRK